MTATALELRSDKWRAVEVTAPTAGYTAGQMVAVGSLVGVIAETKAATYKTSLIYAADKIVVPKDGNAITQGAKVYFSSSGAEVTATASGSTLCGRCLVAAASGDATVEIQLNGDVVA